MKLLRTILLNFGCILFFIIPIIGWSSLIWLSINDYHFTQLTYILAGVIGFVFWIGCFVLRSFLRKERLEQATRQLKSGKHKYLTKQQRDAAAQMQLLKNESLLSDAEFKSIVKKGSKHPEEDLNDLIGLTKVKQEVLRFKSQIKDKKHPINNMHMCFLGNPGTGKTTIAGILTGFLYQYKYIKRNEYIYVDGNFFKSGEDPIARTKMLLTRAKGKILFIDEAYSLVQGDYGLGQQLLSTILNEMENERTNMIVILAGYKKEMKGLFNSNSGLASRIKNYFMFEDYTIEEMQRIFINLIYAENMVVDLEALERLEKILLSKKESSNFANARTVHNLAEKAITEHFYNLDVGNISNDNKYRLVAEDIVNDRSIDNYFN